MKIYDFEGQKNISGDRIHQVRATKRISQADLAARMQVKGVFIEREAISKIETGDRFVTDYELMIFAEVLGVTMDWLTGKEVAEGAKDGTVENYYKIQQDNFIKAGAVEKEVPVADYVMLDNMIEAGK